MAFGRAKTERRLEFVRSPCHAEAFERPLGGRRHENIARCISGLGRLPTRRIGRVRILVDFLSSAVAYLAFGLVRAMSTRCHSQVCTAAFRGWGSMMIEARAPEVVEMAAMAKLADMLAPASEPGSLRSGPT